MLLGRRMRWALVCAAWLVLAAGGCGASTETKAVVATAGLLTSVAVNRAITDECWAACSPGYVCDHESGLCVPGECAPRCADYQVCVRVAQQLTCRDKGTVQKVDLDGPDPNPASPDPAPAVRATSNPSSSARTGDSPARAQATRATAEGDADADIDADATRRARCARPGSEAWYLEAGSARAPSTPSKWAADFVGVWLPADARAPSSAREPLIVAQHWLGQGTLAAKDYRVVRSDDRRLWLQIQSNQSGHASTGQLGVSFLGRDRLRLGAAEYRRADCTGPAFPNACCELPRQRWVRLAPTP